MAPVETALLEMTGKEPEEGEFSLLRSVPAVLRARGFRLYTQGGRRLADLWQNGGAAVLGHTPPGLLRELKNTANRGLFAPLPHFSEARFLKALSLLFHGGIFRLYASAPAALEALFKEGKAALWRPFLATSTGWSEAEGGSPLNPGAPFAVPPAPPVLIPVLPGISGWRRGLPQGLCVTVTTDRASPPLPPGDFLPPVLLAAATRGVYSLIAAAPERGKPSFPRIQKALKNSPWRYMPEGERGIYLKLRETPAPETWAALFRHFLGAGFLLPPDPCHPLILPGVLSPGEEAKLAGVLQLAP